MKPRKQWMKWIKKSWRNKKFALEQILMLNFVNKKALIIELISSFKIKQIT
jgi:hypothetical protein